MPSTSDSFISDTEEELCPLCVEEFDLSDKNFRPCPCGYQVCQFCYNNIRSNLNGRCPACRRPYLDETVEYRMVTQEEWKQDHQRQARRERERKQKEREKKESEQASKRHHLSGMRVIQKNLVYVIGLNPSIPTDELHNTLRGDQFFGQYGRIQKIVINRRTNANGNPGLGVYVTFVRKEDAARCIAAVDGSINDGKYLRAAYGTTKYCSAYLRGQQCPNPNCMFLHEPGEEADSYTRQDLSTIQHQARQNKEAKDGQHSPAAHTPSGGHASLATVHNSVGVGSGPASGPGSGPGSVSVPASVPGSVPASVPASVPISPSVPSMPASTPAVPMPTTSLPTAPWAKVPGQPVVPLFPEDREPPQPEARTVIPNAVLKLIEDQVRALSTANKGRFSYEFSSPELASDDLAQCPTRISFTKDDFKDPGTDHTGAWVARMFAVRSKLVPVQISQIPPQMPQLNSQINSQAQLPQVSQTQLPQVSQAQLPQVSQAQLPQVSQIPQQMQIPLMPVQQPDLLSELGLATKVATPPPGLHAQPTPNPNSLELLSHLMNGASRPSDPARS